jgi:hypothetical protein
MALEKLGTYGKDRVREHLIGRIPDEVWIVLGGMVTAWNLAGLAHFAIPQYWWIGGLASVALVGFYRFLKADLDLLVILGAGGLWMTAMWMAGPGWFLNVLLIVGVVLGAIHLFWRPLVDLGGREKEMDMKGIVRRWGRISASDGVKRVLGGSSIEMVDFDEARIALVPGVGLKDVMRIRDRLESACQGRGLRLQHGSLQVRPDDEAGCVRIFIPPPPPEAGLD